jgi:hypothetical protein
MFEEIRAVARKGGAAAGAMETPRASPPIDYLSLVRHHNPRHKKRRRPPD